ncbi:hypothetical protein O181_039469 [Austropuccinia psidii MF-1]|uniref:Uncharacterized protein n=1 Tax=Austropuccinia psidii MF-1 TaxID=1389203 RepID=A0A9Q3DAI2_9BASI|nr:hypothetical protein [Austropuccinia psidii MF-1]
MNLEVTISQPCIDLRLSDAAGLIKDRIMAPQEHINPLLFFIDYLTERDTSLPKSAASFRNTHLDPGPSHSRHNSCLYQAMASNDESSSEFLLNSNNYVVEEESCL